MKQDTRKIWAERIKAWKQSGETAAAYGARTGVSEHALHNWSSVLRRESRERLEAGAGLVRATDFVEVVRPVSTSTRVKTLSHVRDGRGFELHLGNGNRLSIPERFDTTALREVIGALGLR